MPWNTAPARRVPFMDCRRGAWGCDAGLGTVGHHLHHTRRRELPGACQRDAGAGRTGGRRRRRRRLRRQRRWHGGRGRRLRRAGRGHARRDLERGRGRRWWWRHCQQLRRWESHHAASLGWHRGDRRFRRGHGRRARSGGLQRRRWRWRWQHRADGHRLCAAGRRRWRWRGRQPRGRGRQRRRRTGGRQQCRMRRRRGRRRRRQRPDLAGWRRRRRGRRRFSVGRRWHGRHRQQHVFDRRWRRHVVLYGRHVGHDQPGGRCRRCRSERVDNPWLSRQPRRCRAPAHHRGAGPHHRQQGGHRQLAGRADGIAAVHRDLRLGQLFRHLEFQRRRGERRHCQRAAGHDVFGDGNPADRAHRLFLGHGHRGAEHLVCGTAGRGAGGERDERAGRQPGGPA